MKLTKSKLKQMIKEVLNEAEPPTSIPMPPDPRFPMPRYQGSSPGTPVLKKDMDDVRKKLDKIEMMLKAIIKFHRITDNVPRL